MVTLNTEFGRMNVYDDSNYLQLADDRGTKDLRGYQGRNYERYPFGSMPWANMPVKTIPRAEWAERIEEGNRKKTWALHHHQLQKVPILNQQQTPYCHSEDTEVLTSDGWVSWSNYDGGSQLATVNPHTQALEYQTPSHVHACEYRGEMIHSTNGRVPFSVTPEHRMLVRRWDEGARTLRPGYEFVQAKDLGWYSGLIGAPSGHAGVGIKEVEIDGRTFSGDDFFALLALVISDGYAGSSEKGINTVSYCCFDNGMQSQVRELSKRIGFKEQPERPGVWSLHCLPKLAEWIRRNCYHGTPYRSITKCLPQMVKNASSSQITKFLYWFGDRSKTRDRACFYSSSRRLIDDIQEVLLKIGSRSAVSSSPPADSEFNGKVIHAKERWYCYVYGRKNLSITRKKQIEKESYRGHVFCATVPNGTLVTRKDGRVLVSGNCWVNAVTGAVMTSRAVHGFPTVHLSSASAGAPGKSYRSEGGWTGEAIGYIDKYGLAPHSMWPNDYIRDARYFRETREIAKDYKVGQWWELRPKRFDEIMTCLLLGYPVCVGLLWWGHAVFYGAPVKIGRNSFGVVDVNSWGDQWENGGMSVLAEEKANADEANCIVSPLLSGNDDTVRRVHAFHTTLAI